MQISRKTKRKIERYVLFFILFGLTLFITLQKIEGPIGGLAVNITTEMIGVFLFFLVFQPRLRFIRLPLLSVLGALSVVAIFMTTGLKQDFILNISSEIAGTLIIVLTFRGLILDRHDLNQIEIKEMIQDFQENIIRIMYSPRSKTNIDWKKLLK